MPNGLPFQRRAARRLRGGDGRVHRAGGPERIGTIEQSDDRIDRALWQALADADLLGIAVPEAEGGAGYGLTELCLLLEAQGIAVAPVPLWSTLVLGALPIAHFGSDAQRAHWLPGVALRRRDPDRRPDGDRRQPDLGPGGARDRRRRRLGAQGIELAVPQAHLAARIVVPARTEDGGVLLALVDPQATGVWLERTVTTNREIHPHLHLADVTLGPEDILVGPDLGRATLDFLMVAATIALCALQVGVCEAALTQTATYLNSRQQFGRPLSTFQATMLRAADAAIDIEAMRVTWQNAAWRFDTGRDAADVARVAKWQAAERGQRTVHATQHLHGGMGADITYPIHRYFLWGKQIELCWAARAPSWPPRRRDAEQAAWPEAEAGGSDLAVRADLLQTWRWATSCRAGAAAHPDADRGGGHRRRDYQDVHHDPGLAKERGRRTSS